MDTIPLREIWRHEQAVSVLAWRMFVDSWIKPTLMGLVGAGLSLFGVGVTTGEWNTPAGIWTAGVTAVLGAGLCLVWDRVRASAVLHVQQREEIERLRMIAYPPMHPKVREALALLDGVVADCLAHARQGESLSVTDLMSDVIPRIAAVVGLERFGLLEKLLRDSGVMDARSFDGPEYLCANHPPQEIARRVAGWVTQEKASLTYTSLNPSFLL